MLFIRFTYYFAGAILNDASGNTDWFNRSWDTYWDVKTVIKEHAWFMELRIPFKSLRFEILWV